MLISPNIDQLETTISGNTETMIDKHMAHGL